MSIDEYSSLVVREKYFRWFLCSLFPFFIQLIVHSGWVPLLSLDATCIHTCLNTHWLWLHKNQPFFLTAQQVRKYVRIYVIGTQAIVESYASLMITRFEIHQVGFTRGKISADICAKNCAGKTVFININFILKRSSWGSFWRRCLC
jgi:hypothetical protein